MEKIMSLGVVEARRTLNENKGGPFGAVIVDKDNNVIATLGAQKRESITFDDLPQVLVDALVATEDSRFYQHNGVDMARFMKATLLNLLLLQCKQ